MFEFRQVLSGAALVIAMCGCSDSRITIPGSESSQRYDLEIIDHRSEIQQAQLYVMASAFKVKESEMSPHDYNGCIRINASFDGTEAVLFSFVNWSSAEDRLTVKLNWSGESHAILVISNEDGGGLEATLSTTTDKGERRKFLMRGTSPSTDSGEYCLREAGTFSIGK